MSGGRLKKVAGIQVRARICRVLNGPMENMRFYSVDRRGSLMLLGSVVSGSEPYFGNTQGVLCI